MPDMVGVAWSPVIVVDKVRTGRIRKNSERRANCVYAF